MNPNELEILGFSLIQLYQSWVFLFSSFFTLPFDVLPEKKMLIEETNRSLKLMEKKKNKTLPTSNGVMI